MNKAMKYIAYLRRRIRHNKRAFITYSILRILVIMSLIASAIQGNYESVFVCALVLVLLLIPSFLEDHFKIEIPPLFEITIYLFIFAAQILGEVNNFYVRIPGWDTMLHTLNGFLAAAVGFSMIDLLNRHSSRMKLSPFYVAMVAFCFSMTVGVIWEFVECAGDVFFGQDMQKDFIVQSFQSVTLDPLNLQRAIPVRDITETVIYTGSGETFTIEGGYLDIGLLDTMKDLFVNFIGAIVFSVIGYLYVSHRGKHQDRTDKIANSLIVRYAVEQNEKLEEDPASQI